MFLTMRVTKHWNNLSGDILDSSSLEIFQLLLDVFLKISAVAQTEVMGLIQKILGNVL